MTIAILLRNSQETFLRIFGPLVYGLELTLW